MTKLELGPNFFNCPKCWQNFMDDIYKNTNPEYDVALLRIQRELKKYNARYRCSYDYIEFKSEKDLSFFVLRWS